MNTPNFNRILFVLMCGCSWAAQAAVFNCVTEQNGTTAKITCTICPGTKDDFRDSDNSNTNIVVITTVTRSDETIDGANCGKQITQVKKKEEGVATITIKARLSDGSISNKPVDFIVSKELFSMAIPGGVPHGEVFASVIPAGSTVPCSVKIIDTVTGADAPGASGRAWAVLADNGFTFDGGLRTQILNIAQGQATVNLHASGTPGQQAFLELQDDNSPTSVGGTNVLHTARITLKLPAPAPIPTLSEWGLILLSLLLLTVGAAFVFRRQPALTTDH